MSIEIDLGSKASICLALQCYFEFNEGEIIQNDELENNIQNIIFNKDKQKYWINKKFNNKKEIKNND